MIARAAFAAMFSVALAFAPAATAAQDNQEVVAAILRVDSKKPIPISRLDIAPDDLGFAGGALATADNQTTGEFLGQDFETLNITTNPDNALADLEAALEKGAQFIIVMAGQTDLLAIADATAGRALVINATSHADSLRNESCRPGLLHVAPSNAMMTDAVAQFLTWKKWRKWLLVEGSHPQDTALADAYRRSARKFAAKIVEERVFEDTGGARRTDTGHVQVQKQIPVFTQRAKSHDIIIAADAADVFAAYLPFHTWEPRPVAGSAGLRPATWHPAQEAWGATQFQRRFEHLAGRYMRPEDYQVWMTLRVIGEAATRTGSTSGAELKDYILGPDFELAAFKGQKLTFRPWNGQLRQPVLLVGDRVLVSVSPQAEFLHKVSALDTLGFDEPESTCAIKQE